MRIIKIILATVPLLFAGCRNTTQAPAGDTVHTVYKYLNEYEDGLLTRTIGLSYPYGEEEESSEIFGGLLERNIYANAEEEILYFYNDGVLEREEEYTIEKGWKSLRRKKVYGSDFEENILQFTDSYSYSRREYDASGNVVKISTKYGFNNADHTLAEAGDGETLYAYDKEGRCFQSVNISNINGARKEVRYFYDSIPRDAVLPPGAEIILYKDSIAGDTVITNLFADGVLEEVWKKVDRPDYLLEMTFDPSGGLTYLNEAFSKGADSLEVVVLPEFNSVDSTFFSNGLEVKYKVDTPQYSVTELNSYDDHGNLSRKERLAVYYE